VTGIGSRTFLWVERLWHDIRHGARLFARNPAFTAIAVTSIAFGTGANVAIFSVVDALLLRPLPVVRPSELLTVGSRIRRGTTLQNSASYPDYLDIRDRSKTFDGLVAYDYETVAMATRAGSLPQVRYATFVSSNFFRVLGVEPPLGRAFRPDEEDISGREPVAILSDSLWRADFGADRSVLGRTLRIAGTEFTIVGVAPERFTGLHTYVRDTLYIPLAMLPRVVDLQKRDALQARDYRILTVKGRLRPGATFNEALAELSVIGRDLERAYPETNSHQALIAQTELEYKFERRPLDSSLMVLLTVLAVAVLCVACANVAGLLASRGPVRAREMALRLAIGASRARLIRQLITESLGIAIAGALGGIAVAWIGIALLHQIRFPTDLAAPPIFQIDTRALAFSLLVATACAFLVGLGPSLQTTRVDLTSSLKAVEPGAARRRRVTGRHVLVSMQVALSLVLLTIAAFAVQVFQRELFVGPGFRTTHIAKATIDPSQAQYSDADAVRFFERVLERVRALPGVQSASLASAMPLFSFQFAPIVPEGYRLPEGQTSLPVWANSVDERYFETMNIGLIRGRAFGTDDGAAAVPVAIVNDTLARRYWPGEDAIGKRLRIVGVGGPPIEVVGVAATTQYGFAGEARQGAIYFPYRQRPRGQMVLLAETRGDSAALVDPLRDLVQRLDVNVPVFDVQTMETFYEARVTGIGGVMVRLIGGMGLMGMLLTMVGLYGLVAYAVGRRTREIGIRIAIGATYTRIIAMILRQGMAPAWIGLATGLLLSGVTARLLPRFIPMNHRFDAQTFYVVVPLLLVVTLAAAFVPARRAARVDPTVALRCD
jgi:predicted permease